jgi:hypothetical protein
MSNDTKEHSMIQLRILVKKWNILLMNILIEMKLENPTSKFSMGIYIN